MNQFLVAPLLLGGLGLTTSCLILLSMIVLRDRRPTVDPVEQLNRLLPQIQCAQCGFPGCLPYARAVFEGAPIDLCLPGGEATAIALAQVLGRTDQGITMPDPVSQVALIREGDCIGCGRCLDACPVDAIVGAPQYMHTVLEEHCTGCELCLPPCPTDCIELIPGA